LTNVTGTANSINLAHIVGAKHFIFSSSLAACEFTPRGQVINETTPVSADFPYARSKREAEWIIFKQRGSMQVSIARLAAVYSDWCEFPPVYSLLETWLSHSPISRILGGKGKFAIPYIHINDLVDAFTQIMRKENQLEPFGIYNISPQGSTTHKALYAAATKYYFGHERSALHVPWFVAWSALHLKCLAYRMLKKESFERPWMARYIDQQLNIQADQTYQRLGWRPTPRYHILRRLLFLIENKRAHPINWRFRNESMIEQRMAQRRSIIIHRVLQEMKEDVINEVMTKVTSERSAYKFSQLRSVKPSALRWFTFFIFQVLNFSIKTRDRAILSEAIHVIAPYCFAQGYSEKEIKNFMFTFQYTLNSQLLKKNELKQHAGRVHDFIDLTIQFISDEIEETYASLKPNSMPREQSVNMPPLTDINEIYRFVHRIEALCGEPVPDVVLDDRPKNNESSFFSPCQNIRQL
jgi:nucleoside-diphosphate-sugar epimerase